jgi:hypothetical protein
MIFFEDTESFSFNATSLSSDGILHSGLWLALIAVHETPPHIALISDGKYYSLSTRKVDNGTPWERFINTLERKKVSTLFVYLKSDNVIARNKAISINLLLHNIYKDLQPLKNIETTCLSPIKQFFTTYYSTQFSSINYVFELLAIAEQQGLLKECVSLFCDDSNSNRITLPKYTMEQIRNKIHEIASQTPSINS